MIGLVLVTHGRLAEELRAVLEHVVGPQRNVATVCIGPDDDTEARRIDVQRAIDTVDTGDGVVLLTDMFGGTPSNLAMSYLERHGTEVISGVNLPMLVKLAKVRSSLPLADAVDCAQAAGRKYIAAASHVLAAALVPDSCCAADSVLNGCGEPAALVAPVPAAAGSIDLRPACLGDRSG
jgi:PTS system mannose-specific IIA component